jgi:prepilin-type processing-associated H-X9-DG protein
MVMYGGDNKDNTPTEQYSGLSNDNAVYECYDMISAGGAAGGAVDFSKAVNVGLYYPSKLITSGKSYYCPSMGDGAPEQIKFAYQTYCNASGVWPINNLAGPPGDTWNADLRSSYMYYPCYQLVDPLVPTKGYTLATKTTQLNATHVETTDLIYDWGSIAHRSGSTPSGLNVLWGDGHATVCTTPAAFSNPNLWGSNPTGNNGGGSPINVGDSGGQFQKVISYLQP